MHFRSWLVVAVTCGCAPSLSTFQPAHVPPKGHASASVGFEVGLPVGAFSTLVDSGKTLAQQAESGQMLTTDQKWQVFDAGVNLMLNLPSVNPHFAIAYVPWKRLEVGFRYAGTAVRGGVRYQILDHETGPFDFTAGVGISRFSFEFPLSDQIPGLKLEDFTRWQLDIPLLIGTSRDYFRVWIGPKVLLTTFETKLLLEFPDDRTVASFDGKAAFVGGQGGVALGYKYVFLAFELTMMEMLGNAHLVATNPIDGTSLGEHDTSLSSFVIFPSIGLLGEF